MAEERIDNRFRHGKWHFEMGETNSVAAGVSGARFEKATLDEEIGEEIVLFLIDSTPFAHELKRERFELHLKSGAARTSTGAVLFLLWWIPPVTNGKPFALYEQLLNPAHPGVLKMLRQMARQTHLHIVLIGPDQELLDVYEFESTFGAEKLISISESACKEYGACMDFIAATHEYEQNYDLMKLFAMSEPGDAGSAGPEIGGGNGSEAEMHERYSFDSRDRTLLGAAAVLLKKVAAATLRPAEMVSVAKLQHVFSRLPRVTRDLAVTVSVIGPRRKFDEIETWHYWDVAIEGEQLSIASGGHFYDPRTGGDSFTTMNWSATPGEPADYEDYLGSLWMVPDAQLFPEGVAGIDFESRAYKIEIADSDNPLLGEEDDDSEEDAEPNGLSVEDLADDTGDYAVDDLGNDRSHNRPREFDDPVSAAMSAQGGQLPLEKDTTFRLSPNAGDYLLCIHCTDPPCHPPKFEIIDFWEFREGDRLLITNREEDYPATTEQMEEGGPSLWKVVPCDRLAWVGWRGQSNERNPTLVALVNCCQEGYVYGESASPTLESVMSFGTPTSEATAEIRSLWMVGYDAAVSLV